MNKIIKFISGLCTTTQRQISIKIRKMIISVADKRQYPLRLVAILKFLKWSHLLQKSTNIDVALGISCQRDSNYTAKIWISFIYCYDYHRIDTILKIIHLFNFASTLIYRVLFVMCHLTFQNEYTGVIFSCF